MRCSVGADGGAARDGAWAGCGAGREMEATEGFLRNWLLEAGERSCGWLPEGLSTGRREAAGRGRPEGRGMLELALALALALADGSMATTAAVSVVDVAVHARSGAAVGNGALRTGIGPLPWRTISSCWARALRSGLDVRPDRPS